MAVAGRTSAALLLTGALVIFSACLSLPSADSAEVVDQCYQFTWIKDANDTNCNKMHENNIPCEEPFIRTVPPDRPPNITDLNEVCKKTSCPSYTCKKDERQCMRWVRYDAKNKPLYMTLFCGAMLDMTKENNPKPLNDNCFLYKNISETLEACTCNINMCNSADGLHRSTLLAGLMVLVLLVVLQKGLTSTA